jgi:hypothetical protein
MSHCAAHIHHSPGKLLRALTFWCTHTGWHLHMDISPFSNHSDRQTHGSWQVHRSPIRDANRPPNQETLDRCNSLSCTQLGHPEAEQS